VSDPKLLAAASIMGQALAGLSIEGGQDFGADFHIDDDRVWAEITLASGDVYEISTRWVGEKSP
jgi:hypothetical protein